MIKIKYEKCFVAGVESVKILAIEALSVAELPKEYVAAQTEYVHLKAGVKLMCWALPKGVNFSDNGNSTGICRVGATCPAEAFFQVYVPFLKRCGARLKAIKANWHGEGEIEI